MHLRTNLLLFALTLLSICFTPEVGNAIHRNKNVEAIEATAPAIPSKADLEEKLGRKLNFKEKVSLALLKRKMKKQAAAKKRGKAKSSGGKNQVIAFLLCFFLGVLGIHRFYLGYNGMGILYILTLGLFGIGVLIDLILLIIPNGLTPKGQSGYDD